MNKTYRFAYESISIPLLHDVPVHPAEQWHLKSTKFDRTVQLPLF